MRKNRETGDNVMWCECEYWLFVLIGTQPISSYAPNTTHKTETMNFPGTEVYSKYIVRSLNLFQCFTLSSLLSASLSLLLASGSEAASSRSLIILRPGKKWCRSPYCLICCYPTVFSPFRLHALVYMVPSRTGHAHSRQHPIQISSSKRKVYFYSKCALFVVRMQ